MLFLSPNGRKVLPKTPDHFLYNEYSTEHRKGNNIEIFKKLEPEMFGVLFERDSLCY